MFKLFPTPVLTGEGRIRYALATGSNKIPSNAWLKAKVALLNPSKQSLTFDGSFFFNKSSPSEPALVFTVNAKVVIKIIANFFNHFSSYNI